jgi:hypothetical protein
MPAGDVPGEGAQETATVPQGIAALQVVKSSPGRLYTISVTTAGTTSISIFDNASAASGNVLFTTPAASTLGSIYQLNLPAPHGITVAAQTATTPAMTVGFS